MQRLARDGWLGFEDDPIDAVRVRRAAVETRVGPFLLVALAGLVAALLRRTRTDLVLLSFAVAYWLALMPQQAHFDRYVLPLVPVLAVLVGERPPGWCRSRSSLLVAPARVEHRRCAGADPHRHAAAGGRVDRGPRPARRRRSRPTRRRCRSTAGPCSGSSCRARGSRSEPRRDLARLRAAGVKWLVVSGAVTDRVLAARDRYPREARFYERSAAAASPAFVVTPDEPGLAGPWVRVYRLSGSR